MTFSLSKRRLMRAGAFTALLATASCWAAPDRLVIARHGEKQDAWRLCQTGHERANELRDEYLGAGARKPVFPEAPTAAIMTMTLHTSETALPTAHSLAMPLIHYVVLPDPEATPWHLEAEMNRQNQRAAHDLLTDARYAGKQVLMIWEHFHIASAALEARHPGEPVTLRQLFWLDQPPFNSQVPATWPDSNYNFFWVIDFNPDGSVKAFSTIRQTYPGRYAHLPDNNWGEPEKLPKGAGCL